MTALSVANLVIFVAVAVLVVFVAVLLIAIGGGFTLLAQSIGRSIDQLMGVVSSFGAGIARIFHRWVDSWLAPPVQRDHLGRPLTTLHTPPDVLPDRRGSEARIPESRAGPTRPPRAFPSVPSAMGAPPRPAVPSQRDVPTRVPNPREIPTRFADGPPPACQPMGREPPAYTPRETRDGRINPDDPAVREASSPTIEFGDRMGDEAPTVLFPKDPRDTPTVVSGPAPPETFGEVTGDLPTEALLEDDDPTGVFEMPDDDDPGTLDEVPV